MDKRTQKLITIIFLTWAAILLIVKHNNHSHNYITVEDEGVLTFIK